MLDAVEGGAHDDVDHTVMLVDGRQGGLDDVHTPAMARHLADEIPNATLTFRPDFATFSFLDDLDPLLAVVAECAAS